MQVQQQEVMAGLESQQGDSKQWLTGQVNRTGEPPRDLGLKRLVAELDLGQRTGRVRTNDPAWATARRRVVGPQRLVAGDDSVEGPA